MRANETNKASAITFVEACSPRGLTNLQDALEEAFRSDADTIYLFTDGVPTPLEREKSWVIPGFERNIEYVMKIDRLCEEAIGLVREKTRLRRVRINVYRIPEPAYPKSVAFLRRICALGDGGELRVLQ